MLAQSPGKAQRKKASEYSIFIKSGSVAANSLMLALHLGANAKMLSMLSEDGDAAGSVVTTFQTVVLGSATGCLLSTGIEMGKLVGTDQLEDAGQMAKASWVLTLILGTASTVLMLGTPLVFPHVFKKEVANLSSDFFLGYAIGGIPELMMMTSPQIAFQAGDWYIPVAAGFVAYIPSIALSYLFGFPLKMGAFGIGLGGSVAAYLSTAGIQAWLTRSNYADFELYHRNFTNLRENLIKLLSTGGQLAFQRLTEWGNLFALTLVLGSGPDNVLSASEPAIQYAAIVALWLQGLAHASTMLIIKNKALMTKAHGEGDSATVKAAHDSNVKILLGNNLIGALLCAAFGGITYFNRKEMTGFFLSDEADQDTKELAAKFTWISSLGLIPDALRIISLGSLRSWNDVFWPTFQCLLVMTAMGIPIGYGISDAEDDWSYMFVARDLAMLISAAIVGYKCKQRLSVDEDKMVKLIDVEQSGSPSNSSSSKRTLCPSLSNCFNKTKDSIVNSSTSIQSNDYQTFTK